MADPDYRSGWLLQVPSRVLRALIVAHIPPDQQALWLEAQGISFRHPRAALNRLTVEQLILLINAYPEHLPEPLVEAQFREYRHGRSPTLHLYVVPSAALEGFDLAAANARAELALPRTNRELEQETSEEGMPPRLQNLALEPFQPLDGWNGGLHAGYDVQSRLDYISVDGIATQAYELLFGHIWVDLARAFVALHVHPSRLQPTLVGLLAQVLAAPLRLVRVDKQLKRELKVLQKASCRRTRLVDPNPDRKRFRSITLSDDEDLAQREYLGWDYRQWEDDYPEMASARFHAQFLQDRELSLSIGVNRGSLTLAGAVAASELQLWAQGIGAQIVAQWLGREQAYLSRPPASLDYARLRQHALLEDFPDDLRSRVLALIQALATIQERQDRLFRAWPLPLDTAELALASASAEAQQRLGEASRAGGPAPWFNVMVRVDCSEENCTSTTEYLVCPSCGRTLFTLAVSEREERVLVCANARCARRWAGAFPLQTQCEEEHPIWLKWDDQIGQKLELFVGRELAFLLQELLEGEAEVYHFDARKESLWIRDGQLVYQVARPGYVIGQAGRMYIDTGGGSVVLGSVTVQGDFVGRDQIKTGVVDLESGQPPVGDGAA
jgi:hypothetical protein